MPNRHRHTSQAVQPVCAFHTNSINYSFLLLNIAGDGLFIIWLFGLMVSRYHDSCSHLYFWSHDFQFPCMFTFMHLTSICHQKPSNYNVSSETMICQTENVGEFT